jgi:Icc-related predicted phosphoesterase
LSDWFFTSDLHGQGALYEQLMAHVATRRPPVVIIGGDLAPHAGGAEGVLLQRVFFQGFLVEFARRLRDGSPDTRLLLLMGNDDWAANLDCLAAHHGSLWHELHGRVVEVEGVRVGGISWVPITPFAIKDWERWEDGEPESPVRLEGWVSRAGGVESHRFDPEHRAPTIAQALEDLAALAPPAGMVLVTHSPPRDTACDVIQARMHVGSRALRRFVERHAPPLVLAGHIHEAPRVSSAYHDRIGASVVVNPGQFGTPRLSGVWFDPARPAETLRHTVYG